MKTINLLPVILILLASCNTSRYMYSPSAQNVPVLAKKGDNKLSMVYSTDLSGTPFTTTANNNNNPYKRSNRGFDINGAVALTDHFAIQANYFNRTEKDHQYINKPDSTGVIYKRNLTEIGAGYFRQMGRRNRATFQVFGGAGTGVSSFVDKDNFQNNVIVPRYHRARILKLYAQPAFNFRKSENFAISVSSRLSYISFSNIKTDYTDAELNTYHLKYLASEPQAFWEPAFTNTFGFKKLPGVKFEYQVQLSLILNVDSYIHYTPFNFSLGLVLDIPKLFKGNATAD